MVWPLSMGLRMMASASQANSSGRPGRRGNAASLVSVAITSSCAPSIRPVANRLGAMASTRMPRLPRSRAIGRLIPAIPALAAP